MEVILLFLLFGLIGAAIGRRLGCALEGFIAGALLGPVGWIFLAFCKRSARTCPDCRKAVEPAAAVCPHCQHDLVDGALPPLRRAASR